MSGPAFQFYAADFLHATVLMSSAAVGAYIRMLSTSWEVGAIPDHPNALYKALGLGIGDPDLQDIWNEVSPHWKLTPDGWLNPKLERVRAKREVFRQKQSARGQASARRRAADAAGRRCEPASSGGSTTAEPPLNHGSAVVEPRFNSPISDLRTPISDLRSEVPESSGDRGQQRDRDEHVRARSPRAARSARATDDPLFDRFWATYPRKVSKPEALKAWRKLKPDGNLLTTMLAALEWQRRQPEWEDQRGRFVPHPDAWLRNRRWEDEPFDPVRPVGNSATARVSTVPSAEETRHKYFSDARAS